MDIIDRRIIAALSADGRMTMTALADRVGLSKSPVQQRVRALERRGIIKGYTTVLDHSQLQAGHIAFVQVSLRDTRSAALAAFNKAVHAIPEIEQCHMMAADFDYLLKVRTRDIQHFRRILGESISGLPHVGKTSTYVSMEPVKDI
ncbi:Lrp/AsnC family transcriptional regulator [Oceanomicrobium pacificus]|uniref:Winged helix-turn-helix transcriptional regulator n=1 Tax=Oceanomicrobium pacificus TaxID=2692916 RepID=A0A6B0TWR2_9RHOB|nr:Lrp/AsnC family transcriptional regulator [Oceanomicrobium pacificus]MXU65594.1 winged helix-turn-helix transcriptional regulator [Oceanomicrobium pacificus]